MPVVGRATLGIAWLAEDDTGMPMFAATFIMRAGAAGEDAHLKSELVGLDERVLGRDGTFTRTASGLRWTCPCIKDIRYVVALAAGSFSTARVTIHLDGDLQGTTSGREAFDHTRRDFESVAGADATVALAAGAMVHVDGSLTKEVTGRLVGIYRPPGNFRGKATAHTPAGDETCWCTFRSSAYGPGTYTFRLDGVGHAVRGGRVPDALLTGADVRLPE